MIIFFNLGNSSMAGGFSSYTKFISEIKFDRKFIKFSDFGTKENKSHNFFFSTVGIDKFNHITKLLHFYNLTVFVLLLAATIVFSKFKDIRIWIQSSYLSRSKLLRFIVKNFADASSVIIDVRDKQFLPFIPEFSRSNFISCGGEIKNTILSHSGNVFDLKTPIPNEDRSIIEEVKNNSYLIYAHGLQHDKDPETLLEFLNHANLGGYLTIICGRIRMKNNVLKKKILNHTNVRYIGSVDKIAMLSLLKNAFCLILTGNNEGVPRVFEEAKAFDILVAAAEEYKFLNNYEKHLTFSEFIKKFPKKQYVPLLENSTTRLSIELNKFIAET